MSRIGSISESAATGEVAQIYSAIKNKLGRLPNVFLLMGNSAAVLNAYLALEQALSSTSLDIKLREQIALAVGQINGCQYCLAAHTAIGRNVGLTDKEIIDSRRGESTDPKIQAILSFVRQSVENRGWASDECVAALKSAGLNDTEIAEIVLVISASMFTNYFNHTADPVIDFPAVQELG